MFTHHYQLSVRLFVLRSKHHPVGGGGQAVALLLGFTDGHGGNLTVTL